jgi:hypothetical protein
MMDVHGLTERRLDADRYRRLEGNDTASDKAILPGESTTRPIAPVRQDASMKRKAMDEVAKHETEYRGKAETVIEDEVADITIQVG